ncbi:uncharacterized protein LOC122848058 isoform X2 [Aphidius gifuensis]|uniref:uncharacterized protein LOC122848058 isoform X2 n=1 Tax=Aphidius gifuensis TaxID=684658 RepID=UPI001CDB48A0|nr:uncharacterized protein LOC122848058 isoform X2 [Aphidius gifuensis]
MGRICIVRNCNGGKNDNKTEGPHITLFSVPKDPVLFDAWKSNLPELRKPLSTSCYVCEKHFHPSDILSHYTHKLSTNIWTYSRGLKQLKPKAVPIVSNNSVTVDDTMIHDQHHSVENSNTNEKNTDVEIESSICTINSNNNHSSGPSVLNEKDTLNDDTMEVQEIQNKKYKSEVSFSFDSLIENLDTITYSKGCRWSYTITSDKKKIIFVSSPSDGILRRVDIYSNLSTNVIMDCILVPQKHLPDRFKNIDEIIEFLTIVYNWNLCLTLKNSNRFIHDGVCEAIAPNNENFLGRRRLRCMPCVLRRESKQCQNLDKQIKQEKKSLKVLNQKVRRYKKKCLYFGCTAQYVIIHGV